MPAPIEHPKVVDAEPAATILFPAKACYVPAWGSVTWEPRGKGDTVARWAHKNERLRWGTRVVSCVKLRVNRVRGGLGGRWGGRGGRRGERRLYPPPTNLGNEIEVRILPPDVGGDPLAPPDHTMVVDAGPSTAVPIPAHACEVPAWGDVTW